MARPDKLTKERQDIIIKAIYDGTTYETASALAGIEYDTFRNWMNRGKADGNGRFFRFFSAVRHAEAMCRYELANSIKNAGVVKNDWRAASDYLERRDPENWSKQNNVKLSGTVAVPSTFAEWIKIETERNKK